jgi:D-tyrosyl-tRNA(Tyr) deacylase
MRAVVQRVRRARVSVGGETKGEIGPGLLVLLAVGVNDSEETPANMAKKIVKMRIFNDENHKMNLSLIESGGALMAISQFTLYGDTWAGRRPSFLGAAPPEKGKKYYEEFVAAVTAMGINVATGVFQAMMEVELVNDGPTTILIDSEKLF